MPLTGLSNQWKTFDALIDQFAKLPSGNASPRMTRRYQKIRELLVALNDTCDPTIYVGTSHLLLNFHSRDVARQNDRPQPFARAEVVLESGANFVYRIETRRIEGQRPTLQWISYDTDDAPTAANLVIEALPYADIPPRRSTHA